MGEPHLASQTGGLELIRDTWSWIQGTLYGAQEDVIALHDAVAELTWLRSLLSSFSPANPEEEAEVERIRAEVARAMEDLGLVAGM